MHLQLYSLSSRSLGLGPKMHHYPPKATNSNASLSGLIWAIEAALSLSLSRVNHLDLQALQHLATNEL